jgi:type IV pilus assembly protein PilP
MRAVSSVFALLFIAGCSSAPGPSAVASSQAAIASPPPVEARDPAPPPAETRRPVSADTLVEGPGSRDPFRAYGPERGPRLEDTRPRKARRIPIEQLRVVALVTNTPDPRAMLVDPSGKDYIVKVGELVGRPEPSSTAGDDRTASYRVDRIREGDVVLVREDAANPDAAPATRVLSLPRDPPREADD